MYLGYKTEDGETCVSLSIVFIEKVQNDDLLLVSVCSIGFYLEP